MPSIIEDDSVPISRAVGHLELLYNNTTKQYDYLRTLDYLIRRSDTFYFNVGGGAKTTFLWLIWNVGYRYIAGFYNISCIQTPIKFQSIDYEFAGFLLLEVKYEIL